jgi:hypothetical protein
MQQAPREPGGRGSAGARAAVSWVAGLAGFLDEDPDSGVRSLRECEDEAVPLGGSNAQRSIIAQTREARRIPAATKPNG